VVQPVSPKQHSSNLSSVNSLPLNQQVIWVTGASAGIGAALPIVLAKQYPGVRLVLAARSIEKLNLVVSACQQAGAEAVAFPTDMAQPEQVQALAEKALQYFGRVDALINNAGYGQMGPVELIPTAAVKQQFDVNLLGTITLIQAVIPVMRQQGGGRIINVSSLGGRVAFPLGGLYSASKFALEGLSDALRMELEPFNIRVSVIEPGPVKTDFFATAEQQLQQTIPDLNNTPYWAALQNLEPLNQRLMQQSWSAERVAEVIIQALRDRNPKPRYIAATGGRVMLWLMTKILPTKAVDTFWQRFYGIDRIKQTWQQL
jgi:NAD(P)-dependent dehydrogenase (short-subunit alcohol dehydrogenase family)